MVLLNAGASSVRVLDALNIRRHVLGDSAPVATSPVHLHAAALGAPRIKTSVGGARVKASAGHGRFRHAGVARHRRHR
jgi:D-alanyl-D-alanine carboxypeptidase/D-alanyl-D-alanine endopeptidase (penicillin-binding protein 7)